MPKTKKKTSSKLFISDWKRTLLIFSISVNVAVLVMIIVLGIMYYSGSSYLTNQLNGAYDNVCMNYLEHNANNMTSKTDFTAKVNDQNYKITPIELTQGQINSTCFSNTISVDNALVPQSLRILSPTSSPVPVFFGPNGKSLEWIVNVSIPSSDQSK